MIDGAQKPKVVRQKQTRNSAWFRKYHLSVKLHLQDASVLKSLDHSAIDHLIEIRKRWNSTRINKNWGGSWGNPTWATPKTNANTVENLHRMCDFLLLFPDEFKLMAYDDIMHVYTNRRDLVDAVCELEFLDPQRPVLITECDIQGEPDSIYLKNPQHLYRTYFRYRYMTTESSQSVKRFLLAQENIHLSPSLAEWVNDSSTMCKDYYFFDHDNPSISSMLALINPGLSRKTLPILKDK